MTGKTLPPNFSPGLVFGLGLAFCPLPLLQYVVQSFAYRLNNHYPALQERLSEVSGKSFALILPDMPFNTLLEVDGGVVAVTLHPKQKPLFAEVTLQGSSQTFLALLEGNVDGDALFFSRELCVEGDTEALLILRNALDNAQIDLREIVFSVFGPLSGIAAQAAAPLEKLGTRFIRDMNLLYRAAVSPLVQRQHYLAENLRDIDQRLAKLETALAKQQVRDARHA